jgi:hypothetical protein
MVEENGTNIVQMSSQSEEASFRIVVPDFYAIVIASRNKHWLSLVKVDSSNWSIVLFESFNESSHAVIPELNCRGMQ